ncbi:glucose PTS transporter subunit EIIB [Heyndrickxia acidiproducens]|uniref:glucose PTS transporter subunit EIIB n=1 Tax=Heyndrickxia acidiproducens TaxID=1121084 RepID=UPI00035D8649|nr:PTS glucose/sucrose transporter subunit IIB [Heyndrickxia acidiproducens]
MYTKKEYNESKGKSSKKQTASAKEGPGLAAVIVSALGGADNINTVTNCYTRLRLTLKKPELVNEAVLKNETGASGVIIKDHNVHVVYGLQVSSVRQAVDKYLGRESEE